ncbi:hypothetical protein ES692_06210 [Psychroserpens burtonensis]|uniref:Uncharacterized protein n=1 Tax=Psychroserpens burtonensis TaxID=49278 RepID=A0A5C7BGP7_9FLAO|nr:hypothetical protein [Psychroserpens burtonensis]TXE18635.1 hypothetical protein ES692_06210 [Psychroserpens burtonensis]
MIIFRTLLWQWDVTNKGITLNEKSNLFSDKQTKSFSFPFSAEINEDIAYKLGLINLDNITDYESKIYGTFQIDNNFYNAYLAIDEIVGDLAQITFYYGDEVLKVFDKELSSLNFPVIIAPSGLAAYAKTQLGLSWPNASHQFVKVLRDDLRSNTNYEYFERFLNNYVYDEDATSWDFQVNSNETIDGVSVAVNRNIMAPMPYLLEILKVGFAEEGLDLRGEFIDNEMAQKIIYVPKNYMERFSSSQYLNYSFSNYTSQTQNGSQTLNVYQQTHTPNTIGSYAIKIKVNMSNAMAQYFSLKITQNTVVHYEAFSQNTQVNIDETVDINILDGSAFYNIVVELRLVQQSNSIAAFNNFVYEYKEANLNLFTDAYTLSEYVPDMKFRELFNTITSWFNLKADYTDNAVYLNFVDNFIDNILFNNKSHLEAPKHKRALNTNNLFVLSYLNDEKVLVNRTGQTYSETDVIDSEIEPIDIDVLPLKVTENYNSITAIYPKDEEDLMFTMYNGTQNGDNVAVNSVNGKTLRLDNIYNSFWSKWLRYRTNSETYKDNFLMHQTDELNLEEGIFKYNKHHLIVSLRKQRISTEHYKVSMTTESF